MNNTVYQLSLFIHGIDIDKSVISKNMLDGNNQVWFVLSMDGSETQYSTIAAPLSSHTEFNYPVDIQFKPITSEPCYLYLTLTTFKENSKLELKALARAKVLVAKLPLNCPNAFRLPLMIKDEPQRISMNTKKAKKGLKSEFHRAATVLISGIIDPPFSKKTFD